MLVRCVLYLVVPDRRVRVSLGVPGVAEAAPLAMLLQRVFSAG